MFVQYKLTQYYALFFYITKYTHIDIHSVDIQSSLYITSLLHTSCIATKTSNSKLFNIIMKMNQ